MSTNFLDVLNTQTKDIEEPLNLPEGTYIWKVSKVHTERTTNDGAWYILNIPVVPVAPYDDADDVDPAELEAFGDLRGGANTIRFMFPTAQDEENARKRTQNNLRRFLVQTLGIFDTGEETLKELMGQMIGLEFLAQAHHRHDIERETTFVDVKNWMPLP